MENSQNSTPLSVYPMPANSISLDYAGSGDAAEIDRGIRDTIRGMRLSILAMGLGLAKMKAKGLFRNLGWQSMSQYIQQLSDETKMDQSSIYNWMNIGDAYIKYQNELEQIGFSDSDGPTKLSFLERALETNEKQHVFDNIKNMTVREFVSFAKTKNEAAISASSSDADPGDKPVITERGNNFYVDGDLAVIISKKPGRRTSSYFKKVIRVACEALEEGEVIQPVRLHDRREARRFAAAAERLKMRMRKRKDLFKGG